VSVVHHGTSAYAALSTRRFGRVSGKGVVGLIGIDGIVAVSSGCDIEGSAAGTAAAASTVATSSSGSTTLAVLAASRPVARFCDHYAAFSTGATASTGSA